MGIETEKELSKLARNTFLSVWSYPNPFRDQISGGRTIGKEICDLLVIFGEQVLIFSEKEIQWPNVPTGLAWKRWHKRAIVGSARQLAGAERWLRDYPSRVFIDEKCTTPIPLELPDISNSEVHRIVVARGSGAACKKHFGGGSGSLVYSHPEIHGGEEDLFSLTDLNPNGSFVHVLDDATLPILLRFFDTIDDFCSYLRDKVEFLRSGILLNHAGEENLAAYYATNYDSTDRRTFFPDEIKKQQPEIFVGIADELYTNLKNDPQFDAKLIDEKISYVWDDLIEKFMFHAMSNTGYKQEGLPDYNLSEHEQSVRLLAGESRFSRRLLAEAFIEALEKQKFTGKRFFRTIQPGRRDTNWRGVNYRYGFLVLPQDNESEGDYRARRTSLALLYAYDIFRRNPTITEVVIISLNSLSDHGSSEDILYIRRPSNDVLNNPETEKLSSDLQIGTNFTYTPQKSNEFRRPSELIPRKFGNRRERRRKKSELKRAERKPKKR
jgi:hypothetical protein